MSLPDLNPKIAQAVQALQPVLATVLGEVAPLKTEPPEEAALAEVGGAAAERAVVVGRPAQGSAFVLLFEAGWVRLLGEGAEGAEGEERLRAVVEQGYAAVQSALADASLAAADVEVLPGADAFAAAALPDRIWRVGFVLEQATGPLKGYLLMAPAAAASAPASVNPLALPELGREALGDGGIGPLNLLADVELEVTVELGRRRLPLADVLRLSAGSVIELEKLVGEPLEVFANGQLIAEGEAVVVDEQFGVRITRLASERSRSTAVF